MVDSILAVFLHALTISKSLKMLLGHATITHVKTDPNVQMTGMIISVNAMLDTTDQSVKMFQPLVPTILARIMASVSPTETIIHANVHLCILETTANMAVHPRAITTMSPTTFPLSVATEYVLLLVQAVTNPISPEKLCAFVREVTVNGIQIAFLIRIKYRAQLQLHQLRNPPLLARQRLPRLFLQRQQ
jgi:hypothetical protein